MFSKPRQEGFTLVELLVVMAILAILAAIVVFAVGGITDRGKTKVMHKERLVLTETTCDVPIPPPTADDQTHFQVHVRIFDNNTCKVIP